ncbi:hypothetical protein [Amycolatopsis jejuensis]|uniref:hypothetical protein n=1 Tax=Amycolatopsis jejuensis TaxID=330084 RepID=UPI000691DEDA|nr:hypothetical protein [Amycolatopsis jejuensis]
MFSDRSPRLANLGYFGHMWELYTLWTWLPAFPLAADETGAVGIFVFPQTASAAHRRPWRPFWPAACAVCCLPGLCRAAWVARGVLHRLGAARCIGTALTAPTAIGFALTVVSIQLVPLLAGLAGWRYAFLLLAPGPLHSAAAMRAFGARPRLSPSGPA